MADTREYFLIFSDRQHIEAGDLKTARVYSSDPSSGRVPWGYTNLERQDFIKQEISDISEINPSIDYTETSALGTLSSNQSYDISMTLTFEDRVDRAWFLTHMDQLAKFGVRTSKGETNYFVKRAKLKHVNFSENPYINGVQSEVVITVFGQWQTNLRAVRSDTPKDRIGPNGLVNNNWENVGQASGNENEKNLHEIPFKENSEFLLYSPTSEKGDFALIIADMTADESAMVHPHSSRSSRGIWGSDMLIYNNWSVDGDKMFEPFYMPLMGTSIQTGGGNSNWANGSTDTMQEAFSILENARRGDTLRAALMNTSSFVYLETYAYVYELYDFI